MSFRRTPCLRRCLLAGLKWLLIYPSDRIQPSNLTWGHSTGPIPSITHSPSRIPFILKYIISDVNETQLDTSLAWPPSLIWYTMSTTTGRWLLLAVAASQSAVIGYPSTGLWIVGYQRLFIMCCCVEAIRHLHWPSCLGEREGQGAGL